MVENWKLIESLRYDSVWVGDHYVNPHLLADDWFDGWTTLAALAGYTRTIRKGTLVTNIIYRNPALSAKQALTLDHISHGRLNLGIGATSKGDPSHYMTGVEAGETADRVQRFVKSSRSSICCRVMRSQLIVVSSTQPSSHA